MTFQTKNDFLARPTHIVLYVVLMLTIVFLALKCPKIEQDKNFIEF